ncbi:hypothetical protein GALMADRAFT_137986 [Galerina marginata CBS 339.88]|uniref:Aerobactin siderophore biosynthesis IucA/IucC N-terminal domain-containing protein n=1 Tax=Galerina marginata (strain CBS 339.88) TaxID=685588 RepID=A0A067T9K4_GALM3|nr:hypothetical protein GALMADRAFT_137986 [Galerina marginata CBS 339.88]
MLAESPLPPRERASFAVLSRFLSCLVTESILRAFYVPFKTSTPGTSGILVVLSTHTISEDINTPRTFNSKDIFAMVPLHHPPVLQDKETYKYGQLVGLVDPLDMRFPVYEFCGKEEVDDNNYLSQAVLECLRLPPWDLKTHRYLCQAKDPVSLWRKFIETMVIQEPLGEVIAQEMQSSVDWQELAFESPPFCPGLGSPAIEWEQSLVAGHPTHPMHRARMLPQNIGSLDYEWYRPFIRFVRVSRRQVDLLGQFERVSKNLANKAANRAGRTLLHGDDYIYMPVHELQIPNVVSKFQNVEVLDPAISLPALAQSSIRTVVVPDLPGIALKLAVGVKISSSLRTISHFTANFGPRFSREIVPFLVMNPDILSVELESSSAIYRTEDPEVAKHFTVVVRDEYQAKEGEILIVTAALLEMGHANTPPGVSAVQHTFALDTEEKRAAFLDTYLRIACEAFLPALIKNGVAFEAHAQNVLARFDIVTGNLRGFVIRDLGGLRVHPPTLRESTGVDFQFLPGHCVATRTLEEIFPKFYHTFVHNHIQRLIRVLGLHYNGRGWEMLRQHMKAVIPCDHPVWNVWMNSSSRTVNSKCLMRMRMRDSYRDMVYSPYPNMIQFKPQ